MSWRHRAVPTASFLLLAALALTAVPAAVTQAGSSTGCKVHNVTQDTQGSSFKRMVAAAHDGDRLRVRGTCTSNGVVIDKDLTIQGVGDGATLQGRGYFGGRRVLRVRTELGSPCET